MDHVYGTEKQRAMAIAKSLLDWYDENKRDLPWRHGAEPYAVWVSEVMAQQTRISALLPFYERFMERFPTVEALAEASEEDVLKAWEGLGYYGRARHLRLGAKRVVAEFGGKIPGTKKELLRLPGIGEYTAGAILSIAFHMPAAAVDGNVLRVFSRLENSDGDVALPKTKAMAKAFVAAIMPEERFGAFTQALMELGALLCVPKNPLCGSCPLSSLCRAYAKGRQRELPKKSMAKKKKEINKTILILCSPDRRIIMRRRNEKLLNGLWEFYAVDRSMDADEVQEHVKRLGYTMRGLEFIGKSKHVFTHIVWHMEGYCCQIEENQAPKGYALVDQSQIKNLALPAAIRFYTRWLCDENGV